MPFNGPVSPGLPDCFRPVCRGPGASLTHLGPVWSIRELHGRSNKLLHEVLSFQAWFLRRLSSFWSRHTSLSSPWQNPSVSLCRGPSSVVTLRSVLRKQPLPTTSPFHPWTGSGLEVKLCFLRGCYRDVIRFLPSGLGDCSNVLVVLQTH